MIPSLRRPTSVGSLLLAAGLFTGLLAAGPVVAGPVTADSVATGSVTAGSVTAGPVAAGSVTATPVAAGSVASGPVARDGWQAQPGPARVTQALSTCSRPAPTTTAGFQAMFDVKNDAGWSGADQSASTLLPDGRTLWAFGDTFLGAQGADGAYATGVRMVHNSLLLQDRGCLTAVPGRAGAELVPNAANGDFYWPSTAVLDNGKLVVIAARTRRVPTAPGFEGVGFEAAVFRLPSGGAPVFERMAPLPSTSSGEQWAQYGAAALATGGFTYAYANRKVTGYLIFGKAVTVARVPVGQLLHLAAWRYWNGRAWVADKAAAVDLVSATPRGWSSAFSVLRRSNGTFGYLTKENDYLGSDVISGTSPGPTGPFSRTVVASRPSYAQPGEQLYNPLAHPEQRLADGSLLVSISRNNESWATVLADADLYKPQFFTVHR